MAAPTLAILRARIDDNLGDSEITDAEINSAINSAIITVRGDLLVTAAVSTPTSAQPIAVPSGFVYIYSIELGNDMLPPYSWHLRDATAPKIVFNDAYFSGAAPVGTLSVTGGIFQETLSGDSDVLFIDPDYIHAKALAILHSGRGGTASDLADWHKQQHPHWQSVAEARLPFAMALYGPPFGSRRVRGVATAA